MNVNYSIRKGLISAAAILALVGTAMAQAQSACDHPNALPQSFFDVPQGPQGNWKAFVLVDSQQSDNSLVPVVVAAAGALQGPADKRGLKLGCGVLKNRSPKQVSSVQLRWILVRDQDPGPIVASGYEPKNILQEGHSPAIELSIFPDSVRRTDFSAINFAAITKDIAKDGTLTGKYVLIIGVREVVFEDGSVWKSEPVVK